MKKEITAEQYRKIIELGEDLKEEDLYRIFLGKSKSGLTIKEIDGLSFDDFQMPEESKWCDVIYHNGVLYGRKQPDEFTFGEYLDLVAFAKDIQGNLISIMTVLWRPITKVSRKNRIKAYLANKFLLQKQGRLRQWGFKMLTGIEYEIEDYDPIKCIKREEDFQEMPGSVAAFTSSFFLLISQLLWIDSLKSLKENLETLKSQLNNKVSSEKISAVGDFILTSGFLPGNKQ